MREISRSSHEEFCACPRRFYYRYLYEGTGFDAKIPPLALAIGLTVHKGMEELLTTGNVEAAVAALGKEWERVVAPGRGVPSLEYPLEEGAALAEGLVRGWYRSRFEAFMEEFEILMIEKEVEGLLASNVKLKGRADAVIRSKRDGRVYVLNWKTTSNPNDWTSQWEHDVQMWTEALLMEDVLGEKVPGVIVEGLSKGVYREGMTHSPLIYGWKLDTARGTIYSGKYMRFTKDLPWVKFPVWREKDVESWVNWLPMEIVSEQFVRSQPIMKNDDVVQEWIRQVVRRETDIEYILGSGAYGSQDHLDFFWQNWKKLNCQRCIYEGVCTKLVSIEGLVENGTLMKRVDHHAVQ